MSWLSPVVPHIETVVGRFHDGWGGWWAHCEDIHCRRSYVFTSKLPNIGQTIRYKTRGYRVLEVELEPQWLSAPLAVGSEIML